MGGRVIPMFTNNGVPGAAATRKPFVEKAALGLVLALLAADAVGLKGVPLAVVAAVACACARRSLGAVAALEDASRLRWSGCCIWPTSGCRCTWRCAPWPSSASSSPSSATHALTVGAIGGLIIGMMTRTARGHTARPLRADRFDTACYVLVAAGQRWCAWRCRCWRRRRRCRRACSAALWSAGFGLYAVRYWPVLTRPRLDGKPG